MRKANKVNSSDSHIGIVQSKFVEFVKNYRIQVKNSNFGYSENIPPIFGDGKLQSFPTFINEERNEEFKQLSTSVRKIIDKIPDLVFNSDFKKIFDYYDMHEYGASFEKLEMLFHLVRTNHSCMLTRGDFILTDEGLKCIEFNFGTNLGGWENKIAEDLYLNNDLITQFLEENQLTLLPQDTLVKKFTHIIESTIKNVKNLGNEINTVLLHNAPREKIEHYREVYKQCISNYKGLRGELYFSTVEEVYVEEDKVYLNRKRIASFIDFGHFFKMEVYECFKRKTVLILNGPITRIVSNKINFALLHDEKYNGVFSNSELEVIKKHVPYTFRIEPENYEKLNDVILNKHEWVLKPGQGSGGNGVFIGSEVSQDKWRDLIENSKKERMSILQKFCKPQAFNYLDIENNIVPHHLIFGFFVFGNEYADGFIRLNPLNKSLVINVSLGAQKGYFLKVHSKV